MTCIMACTLEMGHPCEMIVFFCLSLYPPKRFPQKVAPKWTTTEYDHKSVPHLLLTLLSMLNEGRSSQKQALPSFDGMSKGCTSPPENTPRTCPPSRTASLHSSCCRTLASWPYLSFLLGRAFPWAKSRGNAQPFRGFPCKVPPEIWLLRPFAEMNMCDLPLVLRGMDH